MIKADLEKSGIIQFSGDMELLLVEYTIITRVMLHNIKEQKNEETAFKLLAIIGKVAVEDLEQLGGDPEKILDKLIEGLKNDV